MSKKIIIRNSSLLIVLGMLCISGTCRKGDCHKTIAVLNTSDKVIYIQGHNGYPDTLRFENTWPNPIRQAKYKVDCYSRNTSGLQTLRDCYEGYIGGMGNRSGVFMVYVFDEEILASTPWDTIGKYYMILRRYDLTLGDLKMLNWEISYPPTEEMKNVKMYPPYGE